MQTDTMSTTHLEANMLPYLLLGCIDHSSKVTMPESQLESIDSVELRWFSVTTLSIRFKDRMWVIDPFFSRPDGDGITSNEAGLNHMIDALGVQVDRIFVGHSHFDHVLDLRAAALHYNAPIS